MADFFLPVLSHFQNGNPWSASAGRLRYRILPDSGEGVLTAEVWEGPWAYEFSVVEQSQTFPLSEEGLASLPGWLEEWRQTVEARPKRTLAENVERRDAVAPPRGAPEDPPQ